MATTVITDAGVKLMTNLLSNKETCTFKELQLSSHTYNDDEIKALTDTVEDIKQTVAFTGSTVTADKDAIKLTAVAENKEITETFAVNTMAIIVTGSVSGDIVYAAVNNSDAADIQPKYDEHSINRITYQFTVQVGAADNVTVTVVPELLAESVSYDDADTSLDAANVQAAIEKLKQNADNTVASAIGVTDTTNYFGVQYSDLQTMIDNIINQFKKLEQAIIDNKYAVEFEIDDLLNAYTDRASLYDDPFFIHHESLKNKVRLHCGLFVLKAIVSGSPDSAYDPLKYGLYLMGKNTNQPTENSDDTWLDYPVRAEQINQVYQPYRDYCIAHTLMGAATESSGLCAPNMVRDYPGDLSALIDMPEIGARTQDTPYSLCPNPQDGDGKTWRSIDILQLSCITRTSPAVYGRLRAGAALKYTVTSSDGDWDLVAILASVNTEGDYPHHGSIPYDHASLTFLIWADYKDSVGPMLGNTVINSQAEEHWTPIPQSALTGLDYNTLTFYNTAYYYQLQHVYAPNVKKLFDEYIGEDKYWFLCEGPRSTSNLTWSYPYVSTGVTCQYSTLKPDLRVRPLFLEDIVGPVITANTALSTGINPSTNSAIPRPLNTKEVGDNFLTGWHKHALQLFDTGRPADIIRGAFSSRVLDLPQNKVVGNPSVSSTDAGCYWWLGNNYIVDSSEKGGKDYYYAYVGGGDLSSPKSPAGTKTGLGACSIAVTNQSLDEPDTIDRKVYARYVGVTTLISRI